MRGLGSAAPSFSSVLCPVDFSEHSRVALRFAAAMSRKSGARLRVLFVNDPLLVAAAAAAYNTAALGAASKSELQRFVVSTLGPAATGRSKPQVAIALGKPAREILRETQRGGHDAIVIGTKGLNAAKRLLLGSTTSEILRRAKVPVLAVPPADASSRGRGVVPPGWPGKRIVAAIELGSRTEDDIRRAAGFARWFDARLLIVHVVAVPATPAWYPSDLDAHVRIGCAKASHALDGLRPAAGDVPTTVIVRAGHAPDEIAAVAAEENAGLIVMNLRRRAGLFGEPAGACTYQVLCHGVAPVLAVPDAAGAVQRRETQG
jgi:nucleotide-binding universal stress UspA family protein